MQFVDAWYLRVFFHDCIDVMCSHAGFGPLCVALADHALTLMETIMADLKLESLSPTAVRCVLRKCCKVLDINCLLLHTKQPVIKMSTCIWCSPSVIQEKGYPVYHTHTHTLWPDFNEISLCYIQNFAVFNLMFLNSSFNISKFFCCT